MSLTVGDVNGDGKPDFVTANYKYYTMTVLENTSTNGEGGGVSFAPAVSYSSGGKAPATWFCWT